MEYSSGSSTAICELCKKNNQLYTCPRCGIKYCGLECYKSEAHLDCSESFYKQCVTDELKCQENDPEDRKKMLEILQRIQAADVEEVLEDNEEIEDSNDEDCPLDSDDEELLDLETRLQNVNFENPDELWSVLSDTEKQEFEALLKNGEVEKILPVWTPWWIHNAPKKVTEFNEDIKETDTSKLPSIIDVPLFTELQKASASVQFNVINVIYAYAYIALYYYGDYLNCSEDAACVFLMICENMRDNKVFEDVDSAIESVIKCIKNVDWLAHDEQTLAALREAGNSILSGPVTGEKTVYISVALSELHRLLTAAKVEISKDKTKNVKREFTKRFLQKYSGDIHLSKKKIFLSLKKLEYYLSYVKSYGRLA